MVHEAPKTVPDDAGERTRRTLLQGAISVVLVAVAAFTVDTVTPGEVIDWGAYAVGGATAAGTALATWAHRKLEKYLKQQAKK